MEQDETIILMKAAESGDTSVVKKLLDHHYHEIDITDHSEREVTTPLYHAIKNDHLQIVKLIIHHNLSRVNLPCEFVIRNRLHYTFYPLYTASKYAAKQSLVYLLDMGAKTEIKNGFNYKSFLQLERTALCIAAQQEHEETVLILLRRGANPENLVEWSNCKYPIRPVTDFVKEKVLIIEEEKKKFERREMEMRRKMINCQGLKDLEIYTFEL